MRRSRRCPAAPTPRRAQQRGIARLRQADLYQRDPKSWAMVEMTRDKPGVLQSVLDVFRKSEVNITHIESRFKTFARQGLVFHIDFEMAGDDPAVPVLLQDVKQVGGVSWCELQQPREVPWFPLNIRDLDLTRDTLDGGSDLINKDHPGFSDKEYKSRRNKIVEIAGTYMHGDKIPTVQYTPEEVRTWGAVYERLAEGGQKWACKEYLNAMPKMEKYCGYGVGTVPQLQDISDYLRQTTGFQLRPIAGLLSARDFLNALAFRTFFSTQYMRHHGNPFYTPEPDVVHELLGHVPLFADMDFADFSQEIGLASIGASDEDIAKLATVYWFTVEFGVLREKGELKAYGAGLLSSFGELEWSCDDAPSDAVRDAGAPRDKDSGALLGRPTVHPFDPFQASKQAYPITTYQPVYFAADSFKDAKKKMDIFCDSMQRPFFPQYDALTQSIRVTKSVVRADRTNTVRLQAEKQREYMDHDGAD